MSIKQLITNYRRQKRITDAFRAVFGASGSRNDQQSLVMFELARFCGANRSSVRINGKSEEIDVHATFMGEGRREVFIRICEFLNLDSEAIGIELNRLIDQQKLEEEE